MYLLDTVGRRPLVVASAFATTGILYLLALTFGWATEERGNSGYESLVILLFYAYVVAFETVWKSNSELGYRYLIFTQVRDRLGSGLLVGTLRVLL